MSISPPSDIVLDVARAAEPARYNQAAAKLMRVKPSVDAFADFMQSAPPSTAISPDAATVDADGAPTKIPAKAAAAYQSFEAMTLSTLIEASMPNDASDVFGSGTAGSVWKSMLAQQLGVQMAKAGGIGLATQLAKSAEAAFAGDAMGSASAGGQAKSLLLDTIQRGFLKQLQPDAGDSGETAATDTVL